MDAKNQICHHYIIEKSNLLAYHTDLASILSPIQDEINNLSWIFFDTELNQALPATLNSINQDVLSKMDCKDMRTFLQINPQIIWGGIIGHKDSIHDSDMHNLEIDLETNYELIASAAFLHKESYIEIYAIDSTKTIIKFREHSISRRWYQYFQSAVPIREAVQ